MIILNLKNINPKIKKNSNLNKLSFENIVNHYENLSNDGPIECPCCGSTDFIKWGSYERNVIYEKNGILVSKIVKIRRVKCKSCNHTHALMPDGIVPFKQFSLGIIINCLTNKNTYDISQNVIDRWIKQYKQKFFILLRTSFINKIPYFLNDLLRIEDDRKYFLKRNNRYFFQMKYLNISYAPS